MTASKLAAVVLAFGAFLVSGGESKIRTYTIPEVSEKILVDGKLTEECWHAKPMIDRFSPLNKNSGEQPGTKVWMGQDGKNLYLAAECMEPNPGEMCLKCKKHDGQAWADDSIELFLDPAGNRQGFVQIVVNANGFVMDGIKDTPLQRMDFTWTSFAEAKTIIKSDRWYLEMRIPFNYLPLGRPDADWTFHVARNRYAGVICNMTSLLSPVRGFSEIDVFDVMKGIRAEGPRLSVVSYDFGDCMTGRNQAAITIRNWGKSSEAVQVVTNWPDSPMNKVSGNIEPGKESTFVILWDCKDKLAAEEVDLNLCHGGKCLRRMVRKLTSVPQVLGNLERHVLYMDVENPANISFPVNVAGKSLKDSRIIWEVWKEDGTARVASGFCALRSKSAMLRVYWTFAEDGTYLLRRWLEMGDKTYADYREDRIRFVKGPWK